MPQVEVAMRLRPDLKPDRGGKQVGMYTLANALASPASVRVRGLSAMLRLDRLNEHSMTAPLNLGAGSFQTTSAQNFGNAVDPGLGRPTLADGADLNACNGGHAVLIAVNDELIDILRLPSCAQAVLSECLSGCSDIIRKAATRNERAVTSSKNEDQYLLRFERNSGVSVADLGPRIQMQKSTPQSE
ncbi:hypothetical protein FIBSPDRAFT_900700 [Athelia psychrophila]|uniref:Uncharacterized protein n=1 Tax=Athelia psychrophila TaxID=1759441 RepID=A0A165Y2Z5_9AGAM|nr:hypothetical protein FIBSPDRAFT_900700 [Fibularhizoctonia sp. CBS 109695]